MPEITKNFPSIPASHWLSLRFQFKKSIPGTITSNYLASILGMKEKTAKKNIIPSLKQVGMIDAEGKTNQDMAKQFRDDETYPTLCESIIKNIYPQELIDALPDKDSNRDKIKSWFMNHGGQGDSQTGKMATFYYTLILADPNPSNSGNSKPASGKKEVQSRSIGQKSSPIQTNKSEPGKLEKHFEKLPELNINIQIHISSDASPDQIKSIFENMAKYLYKDQLNE